MNQDTPAPQSATAFGFDWAARSEAGPRHLVNEDCVMGDPGSGIFLVADGMGGRPGGAQASRIGAQAFLETLEAVDLPMRLDASELEKAVITAHQTLRRRGVEDPLLHGMGTTLSALILAGNAGKVVNVGDSRTYLWRNRQLRQLTRDHTLIEELIKHNHLERGDAAKHPLRHLLTRCVGAMEAVEVDILEIAILPGDWFLLATDGLTGALSQQEMEAIFNAPHRDGAGSICRELIHAALSKDPEDDVSALIVGWSGATAGA